jgi:hypothetical protein
MRILQEGDTGSAICPSCRERVQIRYQYRTFRLDESDVDVDNVLLGVCQQCDRPVTVPAQSSAKLKAARRKKEETVEARVPRVLEDLAYVIAAEVGTSAAEFRNQLVRYYLLEIGEKAETARRVARLARTELAQSKKEARISVRVDASILERALERALKEGVESRADLVRGLLLAGAEDVLEGRASRRRRELEKIAAVS